MISSQDRLSAVVSVRRRWSLTYVAGLAANMLRQPQYKRDIGDGAIRMPNFIDRAACDHAYLWVDNDSLTLLYVMKL